MKYIGLFESPIPRKIEAITLYAVMHGMPMKQIIRYIRVPAMASSGVEMIFTMGFTSPNRTAASTTDPSIKSVTVLPMTFAASRLFFAPMARPMLTVVPIARPTNMTVIMCIT